MNAAVQKTLFSSASDSWATPADFFAKVDALYHFDLDVCASAENAKCDDYFDERLDGLKQDWGDATAFCNPPYSNIKAWMQKAAAEGAKPDTTVVCLVPARTDTVWFQTAFQKAESVYFIKGRLKFGDGKNSAPFPSCLIIFTSQIEVSNYTIAHCWDWKKGL
jgi:site-specific DNA-methyltransferase (adenine-specific)